MKPIEVVEKVFLLVNELCDSNKMSQEEYLEVLEMIRDDAGIRAEAVQMEIEDSQSE